MENGSCKLWSQIDMDVSPIEWCTLLCIEDNKEYCSSVKTLEAADGLEITEKDLSAGKTVIWTFKGLPYEAQILKVHGKFCI